MKLSPINFPFLNDALGYFSKIAEAFIHPTFFEGLWSLWSTQEQAGLFFSWLFLATKLFGFSYEILIIAQTVWYLLLLYVITLVVQKCLKDKKINKIIFYFTALGVFLALGFFSAAPGNVFDLRADISGSLFLILAIISLPLKNYWTMLFVALAFLERFHNATVLGAITFSYLIYVLIVNREQFNKSKKDCFKKLFFAGIYPLFGILLVFVLRWKAVITLVKYYSSVQYDPNSDWVVEWGSKGFFSFYPEQFYQLFVRGFSFYVFFGLVLLTLYISFHHFKKYKGPKDLKLIGFLLFSTALILLLLIINPTRNNGGVLRFALAPLYLFFSVLLCEIYKSFYKYKYIYLIFIISLNLLGIKKLIFFYNTYDYLSFRKDNFKDQFLDAYKIIQNEMINKKSDIKIGSLYAQEYNFNEKMWPIYLAFTGNKKSEFNYRSVFGVAHRINDPQKEILDKINDLDFLALGNEACWTDWIPADKTYRELRAQYEKTFNRKCPHLVKQINLGECLVELKQCVLTP